MSENLLKLFTTEFGTNLELLLQQQSSKLRGLVSESGGHVGKMASPLNQTSYVGWSAPAGRFAPLGHQNPDHVRRWLIPVGYEMTPVLIDGFDKVQTTIDPQSSYMMAGAAGANRLIDDQIITASIGTATIGVDEGNLSTESWSTSYDVADTFGAGGSTGLTVAKMIEARRIFRHAHALEGVGDESPCMIIGSSEEADLLNQAQIQSSEFYGKVVMQDGIVSKLMGFQLTVSERLPYASNVRTCIAFVKSGIHLGFWQDIQSDVSIRKDLSSLPIQLYAKMMFGVTRTQLGKVVKVKCADTVTGDTPA